MNRKRPKYLIYLVDDDTVFLKAAKGYLESRSKHRISVATFTSGDTAMEHISESPVLVVLDMFLGDHNWYNLGIQMVSEIKEQSPATEVVLLTVFNNPEVKMKAQSLGVYQYLIKQSDQFDVLLALVDDMLDNRNPLATSA